MYTAMAGQRPPSPPLRKRRSLSSPPASVFFVVAILTSVETAAATAGGSSWRRPAAPSATFASRRRPSLALHVRGGSAGPSPASAAAAEEEDDVHGEVAAGVVVERDADVESVLEDVRSSLLAAPPSSSSRSIPTGVAEAARDFDPRRPDRGSEAWSFLDGLASSETFRERFWRKRPLLVRSDDVAGGGGDGGWAAGSFTVERDLRMIDGSYIAGHRTSDLLRNGTKTDTWDFGPIKSSATRRTTWDDVSSALDGGTAYFNTAGGLWPTLGGLCRLATLAFGLPTNVNVYVTPPGVRLSVPPHTDRQDVIAIQTAGAKRWRVYDPPPRREGVDPLNRGKNGDVLSFEELGKEPVIDVVLRRGDVLYVPAGFPHTTDTCTVVDGEGASDDVFDETSVHLTTGLDSHVWFLAFAHLRWVVLQRAGKGYALNVKDDDAYWKAMECVPVGFLGGARWRERGSDGLFRAEVREQFKSLMVELEPDRWTTTPSGGREGGSDERDRDDDGNGVPKEELPTDEEIDEAVSYIFDEHLPALLDVQNRMFTDVDPHSEDTIVKTYRCGQEQNAIMERFGNFAKNEAMAASFAKSRIDRENKVKGGL